MQISTNEYKIRPLKARARQLLGYPYPRRVPDGVFVEQAIGISTDEVHRAKDADVRYLRHVFPLLELGWSRHDCQMYLAEHGFGSTVKSACVGCPYSGNARWRWLRDQHPSDWADAVAFDHDIRPGYARALIRGTPPTRPVLPAPNRPTPRRSRPEPTPSPGPPPDRRTE